MMTSCCQGLAFATPCHPMATGLWRASFRIWLLGQAHIRLTMLKESLYILMLYLSANEARSIKIVGFCDFVFQGDHGRNVLVQIRILKILGSVVFFTSVV